MKRLMTLVLILAVVGIAAANIQPGRRMYRPPVNLSQESVNQPGLMGPWVRVMLRFFAPSYGRVEPKYSAPVEIVPVPPVCGVACLLVPVQGIAE